jgi:hypothetical protein
MVGSSFARPFGFAQGKLAEGGCPHIVNRGVRRTVPGLLDYCGLACRKLHSPRTERMRENIPVTPSA